MRSIIVLLLLTLVAAAPTPQGSSDSGPSTSGPPSSEDPSAMDPTTPPKSISFPPLAPAPDPIGTQPAQCDGQSPSPDCFTALAGVGGYLWFDKNSQCSDTQKSIINAALWDATTLAHNSAGFPNAGLGNHGSGAANFYMGPDFPEFQARIGGNLNRVSNFKSSSTSSKEYITVSCQDTKNQCGRTVQGKAVGGYGWSAKEGWFGYTYHYITLCPPFFTLETLATKLNQVTEELGRGVTRMATDMAWLRTTGQYFLHEMMHTNLATGGVEPDILDQTINPNGGWLAYGPSLVRDLAQRVPEKGGGAARSSINADSYALLANAIWWWDTTTYFPGVPSTVLDLAEQVLDDQYLVSLHIDFNNITDAATADFNGLYSAGLQAFGDPDLGSGDGTATNPGTTDSQAPG